MRYTFHEACWRELLAVALCCAAPVATWATTYDTTPRHVILFSDGTRFIADDRMNGSALYRVSDGAVLHRFPDSSWVTLSPDEKRVLLSYSDGSLVLWNVETGEDVWWKGSDATGLKTAGAVSFSGSGDRFACLTETGVIVFDAKTGNRIDGVSVPRDSGPTSAALGPDGKNGFLIDWGERLHSFDIVRASRGYRVHRRGADPLLGRREVHRVSRL